MILYHTPPSGPIKTALNSAINTAPPSPYDNLPPGTSKSSVTFVTNTLKEPWTRNPQLLASLKMNLMRFTMMDELMPTGVDFQKFFLYLSASCDSFHEVQSVAEEGLRRYSKPDIEVINHVAKLYQLYQGTQMQNSDESRTPASAKLKQTILETLAKSKMAVNTFPQMVQVSFDALYGTFILIKGNTNSKLRQAGMSFVQAIFRMGTDEKIIPVAPVFLSGLLKVIHEEDKDANDVILRGFAYEAIALLSKRAPSHFNDTVILDMFFDALSTEPKNMRIIVQGIASNNTRSAVPYDSDLQTTSPATRAN